MTELSEFDLHEALFTESFSQPRKRSVSFGTDKFACLEKSSKGIEDIDLALLPDVDDLQMIVKGENKNSKISSYFSIAANNSEQLSNHAQEETCSLSEIDLHLSPADNAVRLLVSALCLQMNPVIRNAIVYALDVLKSNPVLTTVPVGLHPRKETGIHDILDDNGGCVLNWLVSSYTPIARLGTVKKRPSLRSVAGGVFFAVSLRDLFGRTATVDSFVYDISPSKRKEIDAALEGVNKWDWDIAGLDEASEHRPLQTLGWDLLHRWGLGKPLPHAVCDF